MQNKSRLHIELATNGDIWYHSSYAWYHTISYKDNLYTFRHRKELFLMLEELLQQIYLEGGAKNES